MIGVGRTIFYWLSQSKYVTLYLITKPHRGHRCGLLLLVFRSLYVCPLDITTCCANTAEPIEVPFGVWSRVGPRNHVLGGGPDPPGEGAILGRHLPTGCKVEGISGMQLIFSTLFGRWQQLCVLSLPTL